MDAKDKFITCKVRLQKENPFFSYLCMNLRLHEDKSIDTAGVDCRGNLYYNPEFIDKLNNDEMKTLLTHEVLHIALLHLTRLNGRNPKLWNIATDIIINNTLKNNNFVFSGELSNGIIPHYNTITIGDTEIKDLDKKFAEEVYSLLKEEMQNNGFDVHIYGNGTPQNPNDDKGDGQGKGNGNKGIPLTAEEQEKIEKEWKQKLAEAVAYGKMQGNLPLGMDRFVEQLLDTKLDWRSLLYKYITNEIPTDYNYNLPSKRSQAVGCYMPRIKKDNIDITIVVDTSGSIGKEELTDFLSEIYGIGKSFENIRLNVFTMDTQVHSHHIINSSNIDDICCLSFNGGGGSDFTSMYGYMKENIPNTRLCITFTDGFINFPHEEEIKTIWALTKNCNDVDKLPFGEYVRVE